MDALGRMLAEAGAHSWAVLPAEAVDAEAVRIYESWIALRRHGTMDYMERYADVRSDPRLLLTPEEGGPARTLVVCLFSYGHPSQLPQRGYPRIADYALGRDYHKELRPRLMPAVRMLEALPGVAAIVCIDSAPLRERYWAERAGLGFVGRNNQLTVPGEGAHFFIATIVTSLELPTRPGAHAGASCPSGCHACVDACPTGALTGDGSCNTARCVAYLTTERRDALPADVDMGGNVVGCDLCRRACPHSLAGRPSCAPAVSPRLTDFPGRDEWRAMDAAEIDRRFAGSAVRRAGLERIREAVRSVKKY